MVAAVTAAGVVCQVAFRWIWSSDINFLKDRIVAGKLGQIRSVTIRAGWPRRDYYYARNTWAGKLRSDGNWVLDGPATNALAHQTNNLLYLGSPAAGRFATPTSVRAELYAARDIESHDTAAVEIQTAEGIPLYFLVSHCSETEFGPIIEVAGDKGAGRWTFADGPVVTYADGAEERNGREHQLGRDKMVANFFRAAEARDLSLPKCTLADTRNYALAADGMHESSGRIHRIDETFVRRSHDQGDRAYTVVEGMDDALARAAAGKCLFSDLPDAPGWAAATEAFDLSGYISFPQRFGCE